jgi:hypothetical protein
MVTVQSRTEEEQTGNKEWFSCQTDQQSTGGNQAPTTLVKLSD